jgi:hypothetical protein
MFRKVDSIYMSFFSSRNGQIITPRKAFLKKQTKISSFSFKNWKKLGTQKYLNFFSWRSRIILISPTCSGRSILYTWVFSAPRNDCLTISRGPFITKIAKIHRFRRLPWISLSWILKNGFQIRIQRIKIGGNHFDNDVAPENADWLTDIHTDIAK